MESKKHHKSFIQHLFVVTLVFCMLLTSCSNTQNICKTYERKSGEIIYAIPSPNYTRKVYMLTNEGLIIIHRVPLEQPLINIPVCKHRGRWYWVMP